MRRGRCCSSRRTSLDVLARERPCHDATAGRADEGGKGKTSRLINAVQPSIDGGDGGGGRGRGEGEAHVLGLLRLV